MKFAVFDELKTENAKKTEEGIGRDQRFRRRRRLFPSLIRRVLMRNKGLGF